MDNNSLSHIKWTYKYHIVFAPKFRRKVIYKQILTNEKYIGDALLQKTYTVSILDKKRATNKGNLPKYYVEGSLDCQHFFRQIFLGYFSDIVQAFDTLRTNVCGDDYTSLHNPIVLSSVLPAYGMFHSIQILFL